MLRCKVEQACGGAARLHKMQVDETHAQRFLLFLFSQSQAAPKPRRQARLMEGADQRCERAGGMGPSAEDGRFGGCRKMGFFLGKGMGGRSNDKTLQCLTSRTKRNFRASGR